MSVAATTTRHKVEVDQRALVDKILARYATDFGALRELVQNADDAGATEVEVTLDTSAEPVARPAEVEVTLMESPEPMGEQGDAVHVALPSPE